MRPYTIFVGLILLALPAVALAVDCSSFGSAEPISSHYVKLVLERADEGISFAQEANSSDDFFPFYLPFWSRSIGGTIVRIIDSRQALSERTDDLTTTTACLRYDQILLECKLDEVRNELDSQLERGSFFGIMQLQALVLFLQDRIAFLSAGSVDGRFADTTWEQQRLFDRDVPEALAEPLCPFHSDYTPPRMTGYGCDSTILAPIVFNTSAGMPFAEAELQGLTSIESEIDRFRAIIPLLQGLDGNSSFTSPTTVSERAHRTIIGCQKDIGRCSGGNLVCGSDEFCASKGQGACLRNAFEPTIPKRSIRGPFSYPTDHLTILKEFVAKRVNDGLSRTFPAHWTRTENLPLNSDDAKARTEDDDVITSARAGLREYFRTISVIQARREASIFPEATDSQLEIAEALSDMRASIGELSRLASQKEGVRSFIVDLAYFLRRSCAFRPCGKRLEQIIRIALQDACFPYANGEFLGDSENNPRWKTCAEAACIQVEGVNLDQNCQEILP